VTELILNGWPEDKDRVPNCALPFFNIRDELHYHVVLAFRDSFAVSIPDIFHSCQRVVLRLS
jgi:hypothetical protein